MSDSLPSRKIRRRESHPPAHSHRQEPRKSADRHVCVDVEKAPVVAYVFRSVVFIDRCWQFGWTSPPSFWGVHAAAMQHALNRANIRNTQNTAEGRQAASRVQVHRAALRGPSCPRNTNTGGGMSDMFSDEHFVDDVIIVDVESPLEGRRRLFASRSYASDCFAG